MRPARTAARLTVAAALALGLTARTVAVDGGDDPTTSAPEETTTEESAPAEDAEETDDAAEGTGSDGELPDWANPVATPGEQISTFTVGDVRVDVYQVGVTQASKDGLFVDPDTNQPLIAAGDDIVFINYVITNEGDPIDLGSSLVSIDERYDDWPYMQGMDTIVDDALYEAQGVHDDAMHNQAYREPSVYPFATGQSYSYATNFRYQPGSPITFDAVITPVDAEGELLHDERIEGEGTGTISYAARACRESPGPDGPGLSCAQRRVRSSYSGCRSTYARMKEHSATTVPPDPRTPSSAPAASADPTPRPSNAGSTSVCVKITVPGSRT